MLTLILIDDQYVQNVLVSFEKTSNGQNHLSGSHQPTKKIPSAKFPIPPNYFKNPLIAHLYQKRIF